MKTKIRLVPETIQVHPLDMEKLNQAIDKSFHKDGKHPANITYHAHGKEALMRQPRLCIIDDEFVGHDVADKSTFYIYESETLTEGHFRGNVFPTYEISLSLVELETYLKSPVSLAEFTEERRGYNSRIRANEYEWVKYLNK